MAQETATKITSLAIAFVVVGLYLTVGTPQNTGIYTGATFVQRLSYPFFHASIFHAIINVWCMLSIVFTYDISLRRLFAAYVIAVAFPVNMLHGIPGAGILASPTVGLSGVCFALLGSISFIVRRKLYYQSWLAVYMAIGFLLPQVNGWLHLHCYLAGLLVGVLNTPVKCFKRS